MFIINCQFCDKEFKNKGNYRYCSKTCKRKRWYYNECKCGKLKDKRNKLCFECKNGELKELPFRCSKCNSKSIIRKGTYKTKTGEIRKRYFCNKCNKSFTNNPIGFSSIDLETQKKIFDLINDGTYIPSRFDNRKSPFLSGRRLSKEIQKKFGVYVSKGACFNWIKKYRYKKNRSIMNINKKDFSSLARIKEMIDNMDEEDY